MLKKSFTFFILLSSVLSSSVYAMQSDEQTKGLERSPSFRERFSFRPRVPNLPDLLKRTNTLNRYARQRAHYERVMKAEEEWKAAYEAHKHLQQKNPAKKLEENNAVQNQFPSNEERYLLKHLRELDSESADNFVERLSQILKDKGAVEGGVLTTPMSEEYAKLLKTEKEIDESLSLLENESYFLLNSLSLKEFSSKTPILCSSPKLPETKNISLENKRSDEYHKLLEMGKKIEEFFTFFDLERNPTYVENTMDYLKCLPESTKWHEDLVAEIAAQEKKKGIVSEEEYAASKAKADEALNQYWEIASSPPIKKNGFSFKGLFEKSAL